MSIRELGKVTGKDSLRGTGIELSRYRSVERAHSLFDVLRGSIYTNGSWRREKITVKIIEKLKEKIMDKLMNKLMEKILVKTLVKIAEKMKDKLKGKIQGKIEVRGILSIVAHHAT